ncbi:hypothetical protein GCM10027030_01470 [Luteococcus sediminum]
MLRVLGAVEVTVQVVDLAVLVVQLGRVIVLDSHASSLPAQNAWAEVLSLQAMEREDCCADTTKAPGFPAPSSVVDLAGGLSRLAPPAIQIARAHQTDLLDGAGHTAGDASRGQHNGYPKPGLL